MAYKLRDEVPVKPRLGFEKTCRELQGAEAGPRCAKELANALRTASTYTWPDWCATNSFTLSSSSAAVKGSRRAGTSSSNPSGFGIGSPI
jgi:hypothetical protein